MEFFANKKLRESFEFKTLRVIDIIYFFKNYGVSKLPIKIYFFFHIIEKLCELLTLAKIIPYDQ